MLLKTPIPTLAFLTLLQFTASAQAPDFLAEDVGNAIEYTFPTAGLSHSDALRLAGDAMGVPLLFPPRGPELPPIVVSGKVRVKKDEVPLFWRSLLETQGYVIVNTAKEASNLLRVEPRRRVASTRIVSPAELATLKDRSEVNVMLVTRCQHVQARSLQAAAQPFLTGDNASGFQWDQQTNAVVVWGPAPNVHSMFEAIKTMDQPSVRAVVLRTERIALSHAAADAACSLVIDLLSRPKMQPQTQEAALTAAEQAVVADPRTNSLIAHGSEEWITRVRGVVEAVDVKVESKSESPVEFQVHRLEHATAEETQPVIQSVLRGRPGTPAPPVSISFDRRTNSLIIYAPSQDMRDIKAIIKQLDVKIEKPEGK